MTIRPVILCGWVLLSLVELVHSEQGLLAINSESKGYDSHPSMSVADDGATWIAWHSYVNSREQIKARRIAEDQSLGDVAIVGGEGPVQGPPTIVTDVGESVWVIWSTLREARWRIVARELRGGKWRPTATLSEPHANAVFPSAAKTAKGELIVAWSSHHEQRFTIMSRVFEGMRWGEIRAVSSGKGDAHRPTLAASGGGSVWVFWDQYDGNLYTVKGRKLLPSTGNIVQVSPKGEYCMKPTALATDRGLVVAWLRKQDVIGRPGVISQWHTLHAAVREKDAWNLIADDRGNSTAAQLTQGLMAKIEPRPIATGGYLGRRTAPMLLADGEQVWLLWERKSNHRGSTATVAGDLLAREIRGGEWRRTVVVYQGFVDYHLAHPPRARTGRFNIVASDVPRGGRRTYRPLRGDLKVATEFQQDDWTGWRPVELPIEDELTPRREIRAGDKTYKLFWADLHCHSNLSADAEGEPDELTHYARDRARLDVVLFSDNDFYLVPMTPHEYELGNFFARAYSKPKQFLSLQGYEWTSRIPGIVDAKLSDSGNWTPPYRNRSFPNHRTVIYPDAGGPILRFPEVGNDVARLNEAVKRAGGLTLTQHQVFRPSGHEVEVAMEITAGWGRYIQSHPQSFHRPLQRGARLGFVANGDSHRRAPGLSGALTGIYAEELTTSAILDALRNRRCYATNGSRIFVDARAGGALMGHESIAHRNRVTLSLRAIGTREIVSAVLIRDGTEIKTFSGGGKREFSATFTDENLSPGTHWYYWRIAQQRAAAPLPGNLMAAHGHLAWSTPNWVIAR